jgi:hypothetical protein
MAQAFYTWFRRELFKRFPPNDGGFTAGMVARNLTVSIPTTKKMLFALVGQGELSHEKRQHPNGVLVDWFWWKGSRDAG